MLEFKDFKITADFLFTLGIIVVLIIDILTGSMGMLDTTPLEELLGYIVWLIYEESSSKLLIA